MEDIIIWKQGCLFLFTLYSNYTVRTQAYTVTIQCIILIHSSYVRTYILQDVFKCRDGNYKIIIYIYFIMGSIAQFGSLTVTHIDAYGSRSYAPKWLNNWQVKHSKHESKWPINLSEYDEYIAQGCGSKMDYVMYHGYYCMYSVHTHIYMYVCMYTYTVLKMLFMCVRVFVCACLWCFWI